MIYVAFLLTLLLMLFKLTGVMTIGWTLCFVPLIVGVAITLFLTLIFALISLALADVARKL